MSSIDFSKGYVATFSLREVDQATWASGAELDGFMSASVTRDCTDEYPMIEAGSVELTLGAWDNMSDGYRRIEMVAEQGGVVERIPIATLLMSSTQSSVDKEAQTARAECSSVLKPCDDRLMLTGSYAPKGSDGAAYAAALIAECSPAPVSVEGSFTLDEHVVFGVGVSYLQAAWTVLQAADWCMRITGDGMVHICAKPTEASFVLDDDAKASLVPGVEKSVDLSGVPNRYYAVSGDEVGEAVNDSPDSATSTVSRGRYVDYIDDSPVKVDGETMTAYAERKLRELSTVTREFTYTREYVDGLLPFDAVAGKVDEFGMDGGFRVLRQSLSLGRGVTVSETLGMEVREY